MKYGWFTVLLLLIACGGDKEGGGDGDDHQQAELPPMSVGTIQMIGPHVYESTLEIERPEGSSLSSSTARVELTWLDLEHYRLTHYKNGTLAEDEYRDGDLLVYRRGKGAFRWGRPSADAGYLMATLTPFDTALVEFAQDLQVAEEKPRPGDPEEYRHFSFTLRPGEGAAEGSLLAAGHSSVPISVDGSVVVDGTGNRVEASMEGSFRAKARGQFDGQATTVTFSETRAVPAEGVELLPPPEAMAMLLERKLDRRVDTQKSAPIP